MKLLVLHLSDLHISEDSEYSSQRIDNISNALNAIGGFDQCVLVVSGDVTQSGSAKDILLAKSLILNLTTQIKESRPKIKEVFTNIVPGNHDVELNNLTDIGHNAIVDRYKNRNIESLLPAEAIKQSNIRSFLRSMNCFTSNPLLDIRKIECGKKTVEMLLLNSACFSTLEHDKGLHYFPEWVMDRIEEPSAADYCIGVIHHAPEWFHDSMKNRLEKALARRCSAILYGHEHEFDAKTTLFENGNAMLLLRGDVFGTHANRDAGGFMAYLVDIDHGGLSPYSFSWNSKKCYYACNQTSEKHLANSSERTIRRIAQSFLQQLYRDEKLNNENCFKSYIFPRLEPYTDNLPTNKTDTIKDLLSLEALLEAIRKDKQVIIVGSSDTGKTTLLKLLFIELQKTAHPIFVDAEEFLGKSKQLIIRNAYGKIYGDDTQGLQLYQQLPSSEKILLVDNMDRIRNFETSLFSEFEEEFGYIVVCVKDRIVLDIFERARNAATNNKQYRKYRIRTFYTDKRYELVSELIKNSNDSVDKSENIIADIESCLSCQSKYAPLTPLFIRMFVDYYCKNIRDMPYNNGNIFGKVFEANITISLREKLPKKITVEKAYLLLGIIAHEIHFTKTYPIKITSLHDAITRYNSDYDDEINAHQLINAFIDAKILIADQTNANTYRFSSDSQLAYFVARELNRRYHDDTIDSDEIKLVLENACFGINGDVLLFLTYLTDNIKILQYIISATNSFTNEWQEFSLDPCNIGYLSSVGKGTINPPNMNEKREIDKELIEQERQRDDNDEMKITNIYDYDEESILKTGNQLVRALSLLSIISKCLPNFEHLMKKGDKTEYVNMIYELPNKIFYRFASEVDQQLPEIVDFLRAETGDEFGRDANAFSEIVTMLQMDSINLLLEIYNVSTLFSTKINTARHLDKYDYKLQVTKRVQHLLILERQNKFEEFNAESVALLKESKPPIVGNLVGRVARHYFFHGRLNYNQRQSLLDSHFNKQEHVKAKWNARINKSE